MPNVSNFLVSWHTPNIPREECMPNPLLRPPLFSFAQFGDSAFQKTRLVPVPDITCIEVDEPEQTDTTEITSPTDGTDSGVEYEVNDSDLEVDDSVLECLTDYCF